LNALQDISHLKAQVNVLLVHMELIQKQALQNAKNVKLDPSPLIKEMVA